MQTSCGKHAEDLVGFFSLSLSSSSFNRLVTAASDPWVCKLADAKREKYQRVKKEKKTKNIGSVLKEISIRVKRDKLEGNRRGGGSI